MNYFIEFTSDKKNCYTNKKVQITLKIVNVD